MRLLCMFDLPVETKEEQREYRLFRKKLIEEGFFMLQYSVYVRTCPNREYAKGLEGRLKIGLPSCGNIRLITVTEKQFEDMIFLVGNGNMTERYISSERMIVI